MSEGITYQNKDTISKIFAEKFGSKSLEVYGIHIPKIVRLLPTNLPSIEADEKRSDNIYELEDGSIAIIDYESEYKSINIPKYLSYIARVLEKYFTEGNRDIKVRLIVIYTADVQPKKERETYSNICLTLNMETAYLSQLDADLIKKELTYKVKNGEKLTDEELMKFIILPLAYKTKEKKREAIKECIELAKDVKDQEQSIFVIAGIVVFADKVIDQETADKAKEWIGMTKVGRLYEREKDEAVELADAKRLVASVDHAAEQLGSVEKACKIIGVSIIDYNKAKHLLERELVLV